MVIMPEYVISSLYVKSHLWAIGSVFAGFVEYGRLEKEIPGDGKS
jgi:hypothetical protein